MVSITEALGQESPLESALRQGVEALSLSQVVTFNQYTQTVLPLDGYVFWVKNGNQVCVKGSLHYAVDESQEETETVALNRVIFSSEQEVQEFNAIAPNTLWIGCLDGATGSAGDPLPGIPSANPFPVQFAFSSRDSYYRAAELYHYRGTAILPGMTSQIIDSAADLPTSPIVTNSLPIWLAQNSFAPVYPSFLVPNNAEPPYVVAHIEATDCIEQFPVFTTGFVPNPNPPPAYLPGIPVPGTGVWSPAIGQYVVGTSTLAETPLFYQPSSQLMSDRVRLTLIGFNNQRALQFYAMLQQVSINTDTFGFQNSPAIYDERRTQVEASIIQQRKRLDIVASYYQSAADVIAQRLILEATASIATG